MADRQCSYKSSVPIPCYPECDKRASGCHASCNRWKAYSIFKAVERKRKEAKRQEVQDVIQYTKEFRQRYLKKSGRKR